MFNFTRAYRAIDVSLFEAQETLKEQKRLLKFVGKYSLGDEVQAKKIKLEELIRDLQTTKEKMQNLTRQDEFSKLHDLSSMTQREFTLRAIVHGEDILNDARIKDVIKDVSSKIPKSDIMYVVDNIMEDYPANTGIRWLISYL